MMKNGAMYTYGVAERANRDQPLTYVVRTAGGKETAPRSCELLCLLCSMATAPSLTRPATAHVARGGAADTQATTCDHGPDHLASLTVVVMSKSTAL